MDRKAIEDKIKMLFLVLGLVFLLLAGQLTNLQLLQNERYQVLATDNLVRLTSVAAPRGEMIDRTGLRVLGNRPVYNVALVLSASGDAEQQQLLDKLIPILTGDSNLSKPASELEVDIKGKIDTQKFRLFDPVILAVDVTWETVVKIREHGTELPGVIITEEPVRDYPLGQSMVHVLGYVQEMDAQELAAHRDKGYRLGDSYGKAGLENTMEHYLRGVKGALQVEVDAKARPVRDLGLKDPVPGNDLVLNIDHRVQLATEQALAEAIESARKLGREATGGAAVMLDVRTGEVLAMASLPSYDPNIFINGFTNQQWQEYASERVFLNRALAAYAPGSTFKPVTATAGLETGHITTQTMVNCPGYYRIPGLTMKNWKTTGHGRVDILRSIQVSNNTFFWAIAHRMGQEPIARFAKQYGLGSKTGIELTGESAGVVPTVRYKLDNRLDGLNSTYARQIREVENRYTGLAREVSQKYTAQAAIASKGEVGRINRAEEKELETLDRSKRAELTRLKAELDAEKERLESLYDQKDWDLTWHLYDTLNGAVGQGYVMTTPLQLANYTATIANGGTLYRPRLVNSVIAPDGTVIKEFSPEVLGQLDVAPETLALIREGMYLGTKGEGTAAGAFAGLPWTAGTKTGTAEVGTLRHALFVGFAPYENPEVALAVVVEFGGQGSGAAAPVGRKMLEAYFTRDQVQEPEAEESGTDPESPGPPPGSVPTVAQPAPIPGVPDSLPPAGPDQEPPVEPSPVSGPDPIPSPVPDPVLPPTLPSPEPPPPVDPFHHVPVLPWESGTNHE